MLIFKLLNWRQPVYNASDTNLIKVDFVNYVSTFVNQQPNVNQGFKSTHVIWDGAWVKYICHDIPVTCTRGTAQKSNAAAVQPTVVQPNDVPAARKTWNVHWHVDILLRFNKGWQWQWCPWRWMWRCVI